MTEQTDLNINFQTTQFIIEDILYMLQDKCLSDENREAATIERLEELLKRGMLYEIMRNDIQENAEWCLDGEEITRDDLKQTAIETGQIYADGLRYSPSQDTMCSELRFIVEKSRETLKAVSKIEKKIAPAMAPLRP